MKNILSTYGVFKPTQLPRPHLGGAIMSYSMRSIMAFVALLGFALQGYATTPLTPIGFGAAVYTVNQGATKVNLTLTRTVKTAAQTVTLSTGNGEASVQPPFSGAESGTDYTAISSQTVSFAVGAASVTVPVTLTPRTGVVGNKTFTASITASETASLGTISTATIKILATDTTKPTLTVTSPSATPETFDGTKNPTVDVTGTLSDPNGIASLSVQLNSAPAVLVTPTSLTEGGADLSFTTTVSPNLGANKVTIVAKDLRNNSTTVVRTFTVTGGSTLSVTRVAPIVKLDDAGGVTFVATPSQRASSMLPVTAHAVTRSAKVIPGSMVKLTATARPGYIFDGWSGLPEGGLQAFVFESGNVVSFLMPEADTAVTATFIASPFNPPTGQSSTFVTSIYPANGVAMSKDTVGFFTGALVGGTGSFTGKITLGGASTTVSCTFFGDGLGYFKTTEGLIAYNPYLQVGNRYLSLSYSDGKINVSVNGLTNACGGVAKRSPYSTATGHTVPSSLLNQTTKGYYTFAVDCYHANRQPVVPAEGTDTVSLYPQGYGYGSVSITNAGVATITGGLADGTSFTATSALVAPLHDSGPTVNIADCPIYAPVTVNGTPSGAIVGTIGLGVNASNHSLNGFLIWIRPATSGGKLYPEGWTSGIWVDLFGGSYEQVSGGSAVSVQTKLGLGSGSSSSPNAVLVFQDGTLPTNVGKFLTISGNSVIKIGTTDSSYELSVTAAGNFTGSFTPSWETPATTKPAFRGIILQSQSVGVLSQGYGYFVSNATGAQQKSGKAYLGSPSILGPQS